MYKGVVEVMSILIKRVFDLFISLLGILITLPIMIIIILLIKSTSEGPVFFKQERLGKNGKVFKIIKFRTMIDNAEQIGTGVITFENDPRITKVGSFLRKTSLDELPQLINVLKGDMSIVGPRPPVPYHPKKYEEYSEYEKKRFNVKPGITGYAQVNGRNNLTWEQRINMDVYYVDNRSFLLDLKIIILTMVKVLKREDIHSKDIIKRY